MYDEYEDYELYAHKRSDKVKWVISFFLIIVLLAGVVGAWVLLLKPEESKPEPEEGGAIITEGESHGMKLMSTRIAPEDYDEYGISPLAKTAYQLTATITPENATNKAVDWTVAWVSPPHSCTDIGRASDINYQIENGGQQRSGGTSESDTAADAVTDYVTVTPTADGALTATVECLQAFGTQVRVTVTSRDNASVTANATVDYTQKLQSVKSTFGSTVLTNGMTKSFDFDASGQAADSWTHDYTTSEYTIADEYTTTVKISFTRNVAQFEAAVGADFTWTGEDITSGMPAFDKTFFDRVFATEDGAVSADPELYNKLVEALSWDEALFEVIVSTTGTYGSKETVYGIKVASDGMNIRVEGIELGDTSIIF